VSVSSPIIEAQYLLDLIRDQCTRVVPIFARYLRPVASIVERTIRELLVARGYIKAKK